MDFMAMPLFACAANEINAPTTIRLWLRDDVDDDGNVIILLFVLSLPVLLLFSCVSIFNNRVTVAQQRIEYFRPNYLIVDSNARNWRPAGSAENLNRIKMWMNACSDWGNEHFRVTVFNSAAALFFTPFFSVYFKLLYVTAIWQLVVLHVYCRLMNSEYAFQFMIWSETPFFVWIVGRISTR